MSALLQVTPRRRLIVLLSVWGLPLAIVAAVLAITPDPSQPQSAHPAVTFTPTKVDVQQGRGRKKATFFEVWLHHPDGSTYFLRDPESAPITALYERIPKDVPLHITYSPGSEGNALLAIDRVGTNDGTILSYEAVMAEYAARRELVFTIAAIWLVVGNLLAWGLGFYHPATPPKNPFED